MTLTVRLDAELEERFTAAVRRQHRSKSEVVTELLTRYVEAREPRSAYDVALDRRDFLVYRLSGNRRFDLVLDL